MIGVVVATLTLVALTVGLWTLARHQTRPLAAGVLYALTTVVGVGTLLSIIVAINVVTGHGSGMRHTP